MTIIPQWALHIPLHQLVKAIGSVHSAIPAPPALPTLHPNHTGRGRASAKRTAVVNWSRLECQERQGMGNAVATLLIRALLSVILF